LLGEARGDRGAASESEPVPRKIQGAEETGKKEAATNEMIEINNKIQQKIDLLKEECKQHEHRNIFFNFLEKQNFDFYEFDLARGRAEIDHPEQYERTKDAHHTFTHSSYIKDILDLQTEYHREKSKK